MVDSIRAMGGMEHEATNDLSVIRSFWDLGGDNALDIVQGYTVA